MLDYVKAKMIKLTNIKMSANSIIGLVTGHFYSIIP